jgi:hypothetical protein
MILANIQEIKFSAERNTKYVSQGTSSLASLILNAMKAESTIIPT